MSAHDEMSEPRHLDDEQLSAALDGRLEPAERAAVESHLGGCDRCRAERDALASTVALLGALPQLDPPRSFLLPEPTRAPLEVMAGRPLLQRLTPWTRAAGALAAALFVVLVSVDMLGVMGRQPPAGAPAPARSAGEVRSTEAAKPAESKPMSAAAPTATSAPAPRPAAPAAAPPASDRAADSAKASGGAAPQATSAPAPPAAAPAAAPAAPAAAGQPAPTRAAQAPAPSPAAAARAPEPSGQAAAASTATPAPAALVPATPPTATTPPAPSPAPAPPPSTSRDRESSLRPWQAATGLLALTLLAASVVLPRLARRPRA